MLAPGNRNNCRSLAGWMAIGGSSHCTQSEGRGRDMVISGYFTCWKKHCIGVGNLHVFCRDVLICTWGHNITAHGVGGWWWGWGQWVIHLEHVIKTPLRQCLSVIMALVLLLCHVSAGVAALQKNIEIYTAHTIVSLSVMDTGRFLNILNYKFQQISCQGAVGGLQ